MTKKLCLLLAAALLSACASPPELDNYEQRSVSIENTATPDVSFVETTDAQWWRAFDDETLTTLIEYGTQNNLDIVIASYRMEEARSQAYQAGASLLPRFGGGVEAQRQRTSSNRIGAFPGETPFTDWNYQAGFDASWELDLFGRNQATLDAAEAQALASAQQLDATRLTIASEIARLYIEILANNERLSIASQRESDLFKLQLITQKRVDLGDIGKASLQQVNASYASAKATTAALKAGVERQIYALSVLTGRSPAELPNQFTSLSALKTPAPEIAFSLTSLRQRPDVLAAEMVVVATAAQLKAAEAQLYPRLVLQANGGFQSASTPNLFDVNSITGVFGPQINIPIFEGGAIRAQIRAASASSSQALAEFDRTLLNAALEVHDGLARFQGTKQQGIHLKEAYEQSKQAYLAVQRAYSLGAENLVSVLQNRQQVFEAKELWVNAQTELNLSLVALYKATAGAPLDSDRATNESSRTTSTLENINE